MPIAVNVDTRESDVTCVGETKLRESFDGMGVTVSVNESELMADIGVARTGRSSWRFLMIAALCLLVGESLFADRLRGRKHAREAASQPTPSNAEAV